MRGRREVRVRIRVRVRVRVRVGVRVRVRVRRLLLGPNRVVFFAFLDRWWPNGCPR